MPQTKTDLNQLVIFAKVVDTRSFTAAGRELGLPKSTVSRKVAQLEERLGVQLLERTTRRLSLTEVGAAFYERCARIAKEIDEATAAIMRMNDEPHGLLRVAAPPTFGSALLGGMTTAFLTAHPDIELDLVLVGGRVDVHTGGFHLALSVAAGEDQPSAGEDLVEVVLGRVSSRLVASVDYLERRGRPTNIEQLGEHDFVVLAGNEPIELRDVDGESIELDEHARLTVNSLSLVQEAVRGGVGLGLLPSFCCDEDIRAGRLLALDWRGSPLTVHAHYPTSLHLSAKVRTFVDFVRDRLATQPDAATPAARASLVAARNPEQARPSA